MNNRDVHDRFIAESWVTRLWVLDQYTRRVGQRPCANEDCLSSAPPKPRAHLTVSDFCPIHEPIE